MKHLKIIFLLLFILLMSEKNLFSFDGDLGLEATVSSPCIIYVTFELSSIPFEGRADTVDYTNNRVGKIYNGSKYRFFSMYNVYEEYPIYKHTASRTFSSGYGMLLDLGFSNEVPGPVDSVWGYARYKITYFIDYASKPDEEYIFYFNSLDSKYSKKLYPPQPPANFVWDSYSADWKIEYKESEKKVFIKGKHTGYPAFDTVFVEVLQSFNGQPTDEFKVWELLGGYDGGWNNELEKNFYVRTTPFPIAPNIADRLIRDLTIGTKVIFDTVYDNLGEQDRYGYNTWIESPYPDYYSNPPIYPPEMNEPGNTFCTPAQYYENLLSYSFGMKITAETGDTAILKRMKKLWISGLDVVGMGDTIHFKQGSTLILERNAEIFETRGGVLIIEGANLVWDYSSCQRAFSKSEIYYKGNNIVNNGAFIVVDGGGKLRLGDNTTLTFDGSNSSLQLKAERTGQARHEC